MDQQVKLMNKILHQQNYSVLAKLSQGSYGQIFLLQCNKTKQKYVLKALQLQKLQKQQRIHQAFIQSLILRKLNHPGIIKIYETIQKQQYFNQIIQYCPYGDVFKLISKVNTHMNLVNKKKQIMLYYLSQILQSLSYLHVNKIIHRDLKPQNIVIDNNLNIKLIDFGTVKINNDQYLSQIQKQSIQNLKINSSKQLVGSAHYLSPQTLQFHYSQKSDIWAFGIIIFKFYHNRLPFVGTNNYQIFKSIKQSIPEINQNINHDIKQVIQACLNKNPQQRPTANQLKQYPYFNKTNFQQIFKLKAPISSQQLNINVDIGECLSPKKKSTVTNNSLKNKQLFSMVLQKRMFFGNYKPRILCLYTKSNILYFAYKYVDTKITKNQVELNMNDYSQNINKKEFQIKSDDKKYVFRISDNSSKSVEKIVNEINSTIREHFKLQ